MPVPKTTDVGILRDFFRREHPEWSEEKNLAASLNTARKNGAKIPRKKAKRKRRSTGRAVGRAIRRRRKR